MVVKVDLEREQGYGWAATSPDMPGYLAVSDTFEGIRELVAEGVPFYFEDRPGILVEEYVDGRRVAA